MRRANSSPAGTKALRHWCKVHFLSFLRMREWVDLHDQLTDMAAALQLTTREAPAGAAVLHQAILTGFLGGIGVLDEGKVYLGARDVRFVIAPGTPLQKRPPHWIVAASLVETQRLYARMVAQVQPSWIESAGAHLVRRTYGEAEWDPGRGAARARETVSLYGRVLSSGRLVDFSTVDPVAARRMFVEEALVRRPSVTAVRIPGAQRADAPRGWSMPSAACVVATCWRPTMCSRPSTSSGFRPRSRPRGISIDGGAPRSRAALTCSMRRKTSCWREPLPPIRREDFPEHLEVDDNELHMTYAFDSTDAADGVTLDVPLPLLRAVPAERLEWLVPGWLREKVIALLRGLPKELRRELVPIPDAADRFLATVSETASFGQGSLYDRLAAFATRQAGAAVEPSQLAAVKLAPWLHVNLRILDPGGRPLRQGRDLLQVREDLRRRGAARGDESLDHPWLRAGVRRWDFGDVPESVSVRTGGVTLRLYPGIEDDGSSVRLKLYSSANAARSRTRHGIVRLAALALPQQRELVRRSLADDRHFSLLAAASGFGKDLIDEVADRAVDSAVLGPVARVPTTQPDFEDALDQGRAVVVDRGDEIARVVRAVLEGVKNVRGMLGELAGPVYEGVRHAARNQLDDMLGPGWVRDTPDDWFGQLPKYLRALVLRLERARGDVARDRRLQQQLEPYLAAGMQLLVTADADRPAPELERFRWMIEEFRLSLFAQELRTRMPISARRLDEQLALARKEAGRR